MQCNTILRATPLPPAPPTGRATDAAYVADCFKVSPIPDAIMLPFVETVRRRLVADSSCYAVPCCAGCAVLCSAVLCCAVLCCAMILRIHAFGNLLSQGVAMANFRKLVFTGRRHGNFSDFGRNLNIYQVLPCIPKLALTGRRHGQFSETCFPSLPVCLFVPVPVCSSGRVSLRLSPSVSPSLPVCVSVSPHLSLRLSVCAVPVPVSVIVTVTFTVFFYKL